MPHHRSAENHCWIAEYSSDASSPRALRPQLLLRESALTAFRKGSEEKWRGCWAKASKPDPGEIMKSSRCTSAGVVQVLDTTIMENALAPKSSGPGGSLHRCRRDAFRCPRELRRNHALMDSVPDRAGVCHRRPRDGGWRGAAGEACSKMGGHWSYTPAHRSVPRECADAGGWIVERRFGGSQGTSLVATSAPAAANCMGFQKRSKPTFSTSLLKRASRRTRSHLRSDSSSTR